MTDEPLLTVAEAAALVGRPAGTVRAWAHRGWLAPARRVHGWKMLFRKADVLAASKRSDVAPRANRNRPNPERREPTAEELDALIEQQMRRLPRWWWQAVAEQNGPEVAAKQRAEWKAKYGRRAA